MKEFISKIKSILIKSEKKQLVLLGLGTVILSLLETFSIAMILPLMVLFLSPQKINSTPVLNLLYHRLNSPDIFLFITLLIILACATLILRSAYAIWMFYQRQNILSNIYSRLTAKILLSYLKKPYSYHLVRNSAELFKNTLAEAGNCVNYLLGSIISIASETIILLGVCLFLIFSYPALTIAVFVIFGTSALSVNALFKKRIRLYAKQREFFSAMQHKNALESLNAVKEVQIYHAHDHFTLKYLESTKSFMKNVLKFNIVSCLSKHILETGFVVMALLAALILLYFKKSLVEFIPVMVVFAAAMLRLSASFSKIFENVAAFHFGGNSLDIVYDVLKEESDVKPQGDSLLTELNPQDKHVSFKGVSFRYQTAARPIFEGLDISFPLFSISALAGETGSGKSTAIDIITGLLTPQQGQLYYRGTPVDHVNMSEYQRKIGYVPQHIFLLDDSIIANVAFGISQNEIDLKRVESALVVAQLESFVKSLPDGLETKIGEKGVRISGGQRQRIGIARALYRNPEILILDEASSALDSRTESELYEALRDLKSRITIILVTHRLATLEHADLIYVLEQGKITDKGSYNELSIRSPVFQNISKQQVLSE